MGKNRMPKFVAENGSRLTAHYNESGLFTLKQASKIVINFNDSVISPDQSGRWLVIVIPGLDHILIESA